MTDQSNRKSQVNADVEATADESKKGGITKRQLWIAPVVMAVNLPGSVFAQVSPVGTPAGTPSPTPFPVPTPFPAPTQAPVPTALPTGTPAP